jgi:hypothetical protein
VVEESIKEARKYCQVRIVASSEDTNYTSIPALGTWQLDRNAAYVHICTNETIGGIEYHWTPETGDVPLVADMSSHILSKVIDVSKFGVIYAGAQKNAGTAGLTLVIVRNDLLDRALAITPSAFHWQEQARRRLDGQHAADVVDLHRGARVRVAARAGRRGRDREEEHRQGGAPLRLSWTRRSSIARRPARSTARG